MIKQLVVFEKTINDKIVTTIFPPNASLGELNDYAFELRAFIVGKIQESLAAEKPPEATQPEAPNGQ